MRDSKFIVLCQPDGKKGCSACCGLLNHRDISREHLSGFLHRNTQTLDKSLSEQDIDYSGTRNDVRDMTSHICSFQGFVAPGRPGCLMHPAVNDDDYRHRSLFGAKICSEFLCPAHTLLSRQDKADLVRLVDDWYLYTIAVVDPESFRWIIRTVRRIKNFKARDDTAQSLVEKALAIHAGHLCEYAGTVFFYAWPEYNEGRMNFSLDVDTEKARKERKEILNMMIG